MLRIGSLKIDGLRGYKLSGLNNIIEEEEEEEEEEENV